MSIHGSPIPNVHSNIKKGFYYSKIDLRFDLEKGGKYIRKKS